mmetsp:Transcript_22315/g.32063  ORF Transcript_22315/g.32063 Transcript_22315/m.32063 type:complete len:756 (-) Transcript_22315:30-2297(-)
MEDESSKTVICHLVGFLINKVVKDESEWESWGKEFLLQMYTVQFGSQNGQNLYDKYLMNYVPNFRVPLTIYSVESIHSDFVGVFEVNSIENLLLCMQDHSSVHTMDLSNGLRSFFNRYFAFMSSNDGTISYDCRFRVCAKALAAINCSMAEFDQLESLYWHSIQHNDSTKSSNIDYGNGFNDMSSKIPRNSLISSFRLWKVAFIAAAGGGAMLTAVNPLMVTTLLQSSSLSILPPLPISAVMAYLMPLIPYVGPSSLTASISAALNLLIDCAASSCVAIPHLTTLLGSPTGWSTLPAIAAGINSVSGSAVVAQAMSGYGAIVAGTRMLKRTAPLKEFQLEPLHMPVFTDSCSGQDQEGEEDVVMVRSTSTKGAVPVRILVNGHCEKGLDPRTVWGADGLVGMYGTVKENDLIAEDVGNSCNELPGDLSHPSIATEATEVSNEGHLKCAIGDDWQELGSSGGWWKQKVGAGEDYILFWEEAVLQKLSDSLQKIVKDKIYDKLRSLVVDEFLRFTPITAIKAAAKLPLMVLGKLKELDDPWLVALDRAEQAGKLLARVLLASNDTANVDTTAELTGGEGDKPANKMPSRRRPITLCGYGMGAKVVFHCLETLALEGKQAGRGIVEHAVLLGAPISCSVSSWTKARSVVAGRLVNCHASNDWLLALLYRSKSYDLSVAGLGPVHIHNNTISPTITAVSTINNVCKSDDCKEPFQNANETVDQYISPTNDVENLDVSEFIHSHSDYPNALSTIFDILRL